LQPLRFVLEAFAASAAARLALVGGELGAVEKQSFTSDDCA
jgi:hypothetical protein